MARHLRGIDIIAERAADALDLVAGNRDADARAAERDAAVGLAARDIRADLRGDIRVVDGVRAERADVRHLDIAVLLEHHLDLFLQRDSAVIAANRDSHAFIPPFQASATRAARTMPELSARLRVVCFLF